MVYTQRERNSTLAFEIKGGLELRKIHPEIADDYRAGTTQPQLARKYMVKRAFHLESDEVARHFVRRALFGNDYGDSGPVYPPLILEKEQIRLAIEHQDNNRRKNRRKIGCAEWSLRETLHAYLLSQSRKMSLKGIAKLLNRKYHRGKDVRNKAGLSSRIYRFRDSIDNEQIEELLENI